MFKSRQEKFMFLADYASMRYWQVAFWSFLCIVNFFTLTLWYSQPNLAYIIPVVLQSIFGLLFSAILQFVLVRIWHTNLVLKSIINILLVAAISLVWTFARMYVFEFSTGEDHIWQDFGGWYFSSIFIFTSWIALFYGIQYYRLLQEKKKDMVTAQAEAREAHIQHIEAEAAARDAQLAMLRYQLNPHFLCNTLNSINALIEVEENEKAQGMTVNLSQFLRYSLDNLSEGKTTLEKEIETLMLYLRIEKTRFEDRLQINFYIDDESKQAQLPSLLLQPIIENSMKHAIAKNEAGGEIRITSTVMSDTLRLAIEDSGDGEKLDECDLDGIFDKGIGLKNTKQRLKILYGDTYKISLHPSELGGLKTCINLPFERS